MKSGFSRRDWGKWFASKAGEATFDAVEELRRRAKAIRGDGGRDRADELERLVAGLSSDQAQHVAHAFSLFFQLVNLCEERARIRHQRAAPSVAASPMARRSR